MQVDVKPSKPKPPPKPKLPPKPTGLGAQRGAKPGKLRLHLTRMFSLSSSGSSQPSSPTTVHSEHFLLPMANSSSSDNLPASSKRLGSMSSGGNSSGEPSPDMAKRRQHWLARSDTEKVRQLLRQQ
jgi:hypothetical protein